MTSERPPIHPQQNMDQQRRLDPQEPWAHFPDGRAMRAPVAGTVSRGIAEIDEHYHRGLSGGTHAVDLPPRLSLDSELLQRGRQRYDIYCTPCHDSAGTGRGVVVQRGMLPPPSFTDDRLRAYPIGRIFEAMTDGIRNMPSYAAQVPVEDRWAIAAYVRALQVAGSAELDDVPPDVRQAQGWTEETPR